LREKLRLGGVVTGAVVGREADRWFISIQVEIEHYHRPRMDSNETGIDVGLKCFAMPSAGEPIYAPQPLRKAQARLRRWNRKLARRQPGSRRRDQAKRTLARIHTRVKNIRSDFLHKLSTRFCRENQAIGVESLAVANLLRNHKLALSITDAAWGEFLRQLDYKGLIFGCDIIKADRFYPSTKRCHRCGHVKDEMPLNERVYLCEVCGLVCDRDRNAALNLLPKALREVTAVDSTVRPGTANQADEDEAATTPCALLRTK
jgi:putative transposase